MNVAERELEKRDTVPLRFYGTEGRGVIELLDLAAGFAVRKRRSGVRNLVLIGINVCAKMAISSSQAVNLTGLSNGLNRII